MFSPHRELSRRTGDDTGFSLVELIVVTVILTTPPSLHQFFFLPKAAARLTTAQHDGAAVCRKNFLPYGCGTRLGC